MALALATLVTACGGSGDDTGGGAAQLACTPLDPPFVVADTALEDTSGSSYSLTEDTDQPLTLVFFGYTHCPDICGQVMATLAGAMSRLPEADREQVDVVFVTTDPVRDDAATVAEYTESFADDFVGLTGDLAEVTDVAASFKVGIGYFDSRGDEIEVGDLLERVEAGQPYDVDHGTQVFGVDAEDGVSMLWSPDVSQAQLADDVHALLAEAEDEG